MDVGPNFSLSIRKSSDSDARAEARAYRRCSRYFTSQATVADSTTAPEAFLI